MRSTDFPFAVMPQRLQRGGRPDYSAPSAVVADLLDPTDIVGRGRLEARETSWRDKLKDELAVRFGRRNAEQLLTLADFTPLAGAFVGNEAALAVREGKRGEAAANVALAALPLPGAGKAAKKVAKAAAKDAPTRGIVNTPDLRRMTTADAVKTAKKQPHLMQDTAGQYIGAPRGVKTKKDLRVMRENFDRDVAAGAEGGDWYTRARAFNEQIAGPNPARQQLAADEQALWSAQANPDTNMNFALQGHNAYEMGVPMSKVRTGQQARTYNEARDAGLRVRLGKKTGVYGQHLDPTVPHATTGTNDIWHARGFGYTNSDGKQFSRALSPQEHRFLDYETLLAVDRANKAELGGRADWAAHDVQAAPWVAGKGRAMAMTAAKKRGRRGGIGDNGGPAMDIEPTVDELAEGIRKASMTYPDYTAKYTAQATSERVPYVKSGQLSGIVGGDEATRAAYSLDPRASWTDEGGRDILYDALGAYQLPTQRATGFYTPPGGALETNPATVAKPLVGLSGGDVDPASRGMLDLAETLRAYTDAQGAGAWHMGLTNVPPGQQGSLSVPLEGAASRDTLLALRDIGNRYGIGDVVDTGSGVTMTNFYPGEPPGGAETGKALRSGLAKEINALTGSSPSRQKIVSSYLPVMEGAGAPGSGIATRNLVDLLGNYPEAVIAKLDENAALRARYASGADLDAEMAAKGFGEARPDIQNARRILSESGLAGLKAALREGKVALPAVVALVGVGALQDDGM